MSHRILDTFAEEGGNFVDTANKYHEGQTEASSIAYPSPYPLLRSPSGQDLYGNLEPLIDLPSPAPLRWA